MHSPAHAAAHLPDGIDLDVIDLPNGHSAQLRSSLAKAPRRLTRAIGQVSQRSAMVMAGSSEMATELMQAAQHDDTESEDAAEADQRRTAALMAHLATLPADVQDRFFAVQDDVADAQIVALTTSWSYPWPVSTEGVGELPSDAYEVLKAEAERRCKIQVSPDTLAAMADPLPRLAGSLV